METVEIYAVCISSIFAAFFVLAFRLYIWQFVEYVTLLLCKVLIYPRVLHRHSSLGPWTPAGIILQTAYITANVYCLEFWKLTAVKVGIRAANLALINMMPLFLGTHLSFLADRFAVSLKTFRMVHRSAGMMSFALVLFHVLVVVARGAGTFPLSVPENLHGLIGGSEFCSLLLLSIPIFRRPSYELFLRIHQALAVLVMYSTIQHLISASKFPWRFVYIFAGIVAALFILQLLTAVFRNKAWNHDFSRAYITRANDTVRIRITASRPVDVKAGQYINIWIPSISWYILQSHPFMVTNWVEGNQGTLELFIQPRRGFTRDLFSHGTTNARDIIPRLVLFSGPHGISIPVVEYETVLMVATDFGIAALLSYLRELIHGYQTCKTRTRRVHLVWQLQKLTTIDIGVAAESLLNDALDEDTLDDSYILDISIYVNAPGIVKVPFGKRATIYPGTADIEGILQDEVAGKYIQRLQVVSEKRGKILVMVSGTGKFRDELRALVRPHLDHGVRLQELEFQTE
ncbi:putative cell surface metalloreductase [Rhexocercosporidium sp. MPI-PUGE-AT-0058]|nr:putative cell surface metalloreductase [Rhexocercosporidium sp. MPI-PUGE-AT-0058]